MTKVTDFKTIGYSRRYNIGNYEHEEFTVTAAIDENADVAQEFAALKCAVWAAHAAGVSPVEATSEKEEVTTPTPTPVVEEKPAKAKRGPKKKVEPEIDEEDDILDDDLANGFDEDAEDVEDGEKESDKKSSEESADEEVVEESDSEEESSEEEDDAGTPARNARDRDAGRSDSKSGSRKRAASAARSATGGTPGTGTSGGTKSGTTGTGPRRGSSAGADAGTTVDEVDGETVPPKKAFKKKGQTYARDNQLHKKLVVEFLKKEVKGFPADPAIKGKALVVSKKMQDKDFLDEEGNVLASFKDDFKKLMKSKA